jgi:hypothetical protein
MAPVTVVLFAVVLVAGYLGRLDVVRILVSS